jgi:biotin carboxyl carrier protein
MRFSHFTAMTLIAALHLVVPFILILWTWRRSYASITALSLQALVLFSYTAFIFLMGSWVFASFYLRYAILILAAAVIIRSLMCVGNLPFFVMPHFLGWVAYCAGVVITAVLVYLVVGAIRSHFYDETPVNLAFPFRNGTYAVFEGGNGRASSLMNYHYGASIHKGAQTNLSMRYAVDITKVTRWGNDADGFLPMQNEKYAVFNQIVYSPCDGEVSDVEDKWPNETPWTGSPPYNVGNHVLVTSNDFGVLMGHLQKGSILVKTGDRVKKGQPVARTGNSGWTSQPHLHIQAMRESTGSFWGWEGIPIFFDGKNPVKNSLFFED